MAKKKVTAKFYAWQESPDGRHFPLYNIVGGASDGSTVSDLALENLGIEVPKTPTFEEWQKMVENCKHKRTLRIAGKIVCKRCRTTIGTYKYFIKRGKL